MTRANTSMRCINTGSSMVFRYGVGCAALVFAWSSLAQAEELYRYKNEDGVTVVNWQIPPELAANGYEVITEQGLVLRTVPRSLTAEERANLNSEELAERERLEAEEAQSRRDESLLRRYSSVEDIEAARSRSLRELQVRISILTSNRRTQRQRVENHQARIAAAERDEREPSELDLQAIEGLKREIANTERSIMDREQEVSHVSAGYQNDIERFRELQEIVELRVLLGQYKHQLGLPMRFLNVDDVDYMLCLN